MAYPTTKSEQLHYWVRQLDYAQRRMEPYWLASRVLRRQYENLATTNREQWEEDQGVDTDESVTARVKANLIFGWIDQTVANLVERNPSFSTTPLNKDSTDGAPVVSAVTNYQYHETGQLRQDERCTLDAFLGPWGVKKLGYTIDIDERVLRITETATIDLGDDASQEDQFLIEGVPVRITKEHDHKFHLIGHENTMAGLREGAEELGLTDDQIENAMDLLEDHISVHKQFRDRGSPDLHTGIKYESPYGQRWNPEDFLIDPLAQDGIKDARWIAFRWKRPLDEVRANPYYSNMEGLEATARVDVPSNFPTFSQLDNGAGFDAQMYSDDQDLVIGWEVWIRDFPIRVNRKSNVLLTIAEGHEQFLQYQEQWPYSRIEDFPAEVLSFHYTSDNWFTKPGLVLAGADNVQALANEILDSFLSIIRKEKNIILYDPDVIEEDVIDNMQVAPDMSTYPVRGMSNTRGKAVEALTFGQINSDKQMMLNTITDLFDRAAGTPQPVSSGGETATEASIAERRTTAREARRGNLLAEFQINTMRKFWQLTTQFKPDKLILIHPNADEWVEITDEIAKGEYRFRIDVSSQAAAIALERKNWLDLLNLFSGLTPVFMELYQQAPNLAEIAKRLLTQGYNDLAPEVILPMLKLSDEDRAGNEAALLAQQQAQADAELAATQGAASNGGTQAGGRATPSATGIPSEVTEAGTGPGPSLPRQFNTGAASPANELASSETV